MTVGCMRWLQRRHAIQAAGRIAVTRNDLVAPLLCEKFTLFGGQLATTALQAEHLQMIIEPTYCAGDDVRMR